MNALGLVLDARANGRTVMEEPHAKAVLAAFGMSVPAGIKVRSAAEVAKSATGLRPPFAVKLISPDAVHKSDLGLVRIGIADINAASRIVAEFTELAHAQNLRVDGFLVEEMAPAGRELVIGGKIDPRFGPVIMVGLGGIFVEIFQDIAFRICPIERADAENMLDCLKAAPLLAGARGQAPIARGAVIDVLLRIGGRDGLLMRLAPYISELDINPLIVSTKEAVAADARIVLTEMPRE